MIEEEKIILENNGEISIDDDNSSIEEIKEEDLIYEGSYKVKLSNFEGPLDLLLHLIKESKMSIEDVKLADITEQYLDYLKDIDELDLEKASEFIQIAATLIEIKSKKLLPIEQDEAIDEEEMLKQSLREREIHIQELKLLQEAALDLQKIEDVNKMYKAPDKSASNVRIRLKDMVLENLLDAFANLLFRVEKKEQENEVKKIQKDRFTVAEKIISIKNAVRESKVVKFSSLFTDEDLTKSEVLNIFLAVLELLKLQFIKVKQPEMFGEIDIFENQEKVEN